MYLVIPSIEEWALCEHEKASLTYISPRLEIVFEKESSFFSSPS